MLDGCLFGFAVAWLFADFARWEAGIGPGGVVRCRAAVSRGVAGAVGGVGDRGRGPVRGLPAERALVAAPVSGRGVGGVDGPLEAPGLVPASAGGRGRGVGV